MDPIEFEQWTENEKQRLQLSNAVIDRIFVNNSIFHGKDFFDKFFPESANNGGRDDDDNEDGSLFIIPFQNDQGFGAFRRPDPYQRIHFYGKRNYGLFRITAQSSSSSRKKKIRKISLDELSSDPQPINFFRNNDEIISMVVRFLPLDTSFFSPFFVSKQFNRVMKEYVKSNTKVRNVIRGIWRYRPTFSF